jgi:hypothetical protein
MNIFQGDDISLVLVRLARMGQILIIGITLAASVAICRPSIAQSGDKTMVGISRGASLMLELHRQCSDFFEIDERDARIVAPP